MLLSALEINNHLLAYKKSVTKDGEEKEEVAKSMMVVMVDSSPSSNLPMPNSHVQRCVDITCMGGCERLERCGFRVLTCTCDGLSVNRTFFQVA